MKIGVVAFTTTLMLAGTSHAADIALICSDAKGKEDRGKVKGWVSLAGIAEISYAFRHLRE